MSAELADGQLDRSLRRNGAVIMSVFAFVWSFGVPGFTDPTLQWTALVATLVVTVLLVALATADGQWSGNGGCPRIGNVGTTSLALCRPWRSASPSPRSSLLATLRSSRRWSA